MQSNCNLCGQDNYSVLEEAEGHFKLVRCNSCGLVYVTPLPLKEFIQDYYNLNYYLNLKEQQTKTLKIWQERLKIIEKLQKKDRLLDVGCGAGTFLSLAQKNGWKVYGTEISGEICSYLKEKLGLEIYYGQLQDAGFPGEYFDVVTFWHVLEHLQDPLGALRAANRILKKDGLLIVATPNINSYFYKLASIFSRIRNKPFFLFGKKGTELHLYCFSPPTIQRMLKEAGFSLFLMAPDISGITFLKRMIDKFANLFFYPFKLNIPLAIVAYARK